MKQLTDKEKQYAFLSSLVHAAFTHTDDANETYFEVYGAIIVARDNETIDEYTAKCLIEAADYECEAHL